MADRKISDLTALTAPASGDYLPIVDISEAAAANKNKRITIEELFRGVPLGTAAAPSIAIEGDENTGIYSPGADQLAISTGGVGRLFVDASGNVGIGASSPANGRLNVSNTTNQITLDTTDTATYGRLDIGHFTNGTFIGTYAGSNTASDLIRFGTGGTERLRITSTGTVNIVGAGTAGSTQAISFNGSAPVNSLVVDSSGRCGIGTSSPSYTLDVTGTHRNSGIYFNQNDTPQSAQGTISQHSVVGLTSRGITASVFDWSVYSAAGTAIISNQTGTNKVSFPGGEVSFTGGNVGIGTSTPRGIVHVGADLNSGATDAAAINIKQTSTTKNTGIYLERSADRRGHYIYISSNNDALTFERNNVGTSAVTMVLDREGKVGIGTTSPVRKLSVSNGGAEGIEFGPGLTSNVNYEVHYNRTTAAYISKQTEAAQHIFNSATGEVARIDSSGRLLVGTSSSAGTGSLLQTRSDNYSALNQENFFSAANANGPNLIFAKSRGSAASPSVVSAEDYLGIIRFRGYDGTDYDTSGAEITVQVDGTPGANDMPGRLVFSTTADGASSPTERMRISSAGQVFVGKTADNDNAGITFYTLGSAYIVRDGGSCLALNRLNSDGTIVSFNRSTTTVGTISVTTTATAYNTSSDYRLKENVAEVTDGITRLQQLKPSRFNFIADPDKTVDGFIAHEVQDIVPEAITGEKDAVDDDGNPIYQGIDQSKLVPLLTAALQEAVAKIESLEARLTAAGI